MDRAAPTHPSWRPAWPTGTPHWRRRGWPSGWPRGQSGTGCTSSARAPDPSTCSACARQTPIQRETWRPGAQRRDSEISNHDTGTWLTRLGSLGNFDIIMPVRFLRMKPGHGEVLITEGDVELAEDERRLIEEFRRQLDAGLWAAPFPTTPLRAGPTRRWCARLTMSPGMPPA